MYKVYKVKIKVVQEQRIQLKMKLLLGYNIKSIIHKGDINLRWGRMKIWLGSVLGDFTSWRWKFSDSAGPPPKYRINIVHILLTFTKISCVNIEKKSKIVLSRCTKAVLNSL